MQTEDDADNAAIGEVHEAISVWWVFTSKKINLAI